MTDFVKQLKAGFGMQWIRKVLGFRENSFNRYFGGVLCLDMNSPHPARNSAKTLFSQVWEVMSANVKKNALDMAAKRATIVVQEDNQVERKKWCEGVEIARASGI